MKKTFNGERLKEARLYNKMTLTELAEKLNVTKQAISKYETGKNSPTFENSLQFYEVLGFPREFFYTGDTFHFESEGTFFRSRLTATQKSKQPAELLIKYSVIVRDFLSHYIEFPELKNRENYQNITNIETLSSCIREDVGLGEGPISDIVEVAELMGFTVINSDYQEDKVDAFSSMNRIDSRHYFVITTGESRSFYRQQFSIAHEIGHWVLHQHLNPAELDKEEYRLMEDQANKFASAFLLPRESFGKQLQTQKADDIETYFNLKRIWNVSMAAMIKRAYDLKIISIEVQTKLYKQMSYRRWRNPEPFDLDTKRTIPVAFKQSIDLLIDANVLQGHEVPVKIAQQYNLYLTNTMLAMVCGVNETVFTNNNESKVIMKLKSFLPSIDSEANYGN